MPTGEAARLSRPGGQRGFTYLWLLFALALGGVALAALGEQELTRQRRDREAELRFRGEAIATALGRYAEATPAGHLPLPQRLEDLLADRRFPRERRHLRQLYPDPFTGQADWEVVTGQAQVVGRAAGEGGASPSPTTPAVGTGIVGVRSRSARPLLASAGHATAHDWVFMAAPAAPAAPAATQP
ncbi:type II secretion system GspH family protein [Pelomonas sp. P7]|uniref:Type II secretion system GspH family protein n=1 Tax=Pelomonas caseinilytica TaxID=2906763 RepID=A0ABS8XAT5_9BURK|nr:type II secretion system protein [Pelomonas sp. P7]MCE4538054.1 type II secretion system GspH family protein [Pelomonas sp. P7]